MLVSLDPQRLNQRVDLTHLDGLWAYLTPDTTSAQQAEGIVELDVFAPERWPCSIRWMLYA